MAMRPRTPTFRTQPSARRFYENLEPSSETKETPEAFLLHVYLPGYTRDRVKITFVGSSRVVRITGERPIQGNRWSRFDKTYPFPENCEPESLQGKFDMGTLVLTMPKKPISQVAAPKPEVNNTTPERSGPGPSVAAEEKTQKSQETIPQQQKTTKLEEQNGDNKERASLQKGQEQTVERPAVIDKPQKGQEESESKQNSTMTRKIQKDDEKPPKREGKDEPKLTLTEATRDDQAEEKRDEEMKLKARLAAVKKQLEGKTDEVAEKEAKEQDVKSSESRKDVSNLEKGVFKEKEIRTRKVPRKEAEPSAPKVQEKDKEFISASENIVDIVGNGIRELAAAASHVVTRIAEGKLNQEEKHLAVNMGAAVLVIVALGAYVSHKFA